MKLGLIVNLEAKKIKSGKVKVENLVKRLEKGKYMIRYIEYPFRSIFYILDEFRYAGVDVVALAGGDGTIHKSITKMIEFKEIYEFMPYVTFLKCGTMNSIAKALGFDDPYSTLEKIVEENVEITDVPLQKFHCFGNEEKTYYGFIMCGLAIVNFAQRYYSNKIWLMKNPSKTKGIYLFFKTLLSCLCNTKFFNEIAQKAEMEITLYKDKDEEIKIYDSFNLFVTSAIPISIFGINAFKELNSKNSLGFITGLVNYKHIVQNFLVPRILIGKKPEGVYYEYADKVEISKADKKNFYVLIDGEIYCCNKIISQYYRSLKVLKPKRNS